MQSEVSEKSGNENIRLLKIHINKKSKEQKKFREFEKVEHCN